MRPALVKDSGYCEIVAGAPMMVPNITRFCTCCDDPPLADLETFFAEMDRFAGKRVLVHCYANARASAFVYLWRTLQAGHDDAQARAAMIKIWDLNDGYEFLNVEQWQRFVANAQNAAPQTGR